MTEKSNLIGDIWGMFISLMILYFVISTINSLVNNYLVNFYLKNKFLGRRRKHNFNLKK
jgi:hypothetical protein